MPKRVPYCPRGGCGMFNGAAPIPEIICKRCMHKQPAGRQPKKICPSCHYCLECGRVSKKVFEQGEELARVWCQDE